MYRGFPIAMFEYQMVLCHDSWWGFAWICTITSYNITLYFNSWIWHNMNNHPIYLSYTSDFFMAEKQKKKQQVAAQLAVRRGHPSQRILWKPPWLCAEVKRGSLTWTLFLGRFMIYIYIWGLLMVNTGESWFNYGRYGRYMNYIFSDIEP